MRDAVYRQRYSGCRDKAAAAVHLRVLVAEMDRVMTRSRAVEGKLLVLEKMTRLAAVAADTQGSSSNQPNRVAVEVHRIGKATRTAG
jgi:hypothetical protein